MMLSDVRETFQPLPWQAQPWQYLLESQQRDRLPHGVLLRGAEGIGKSHFALAFGHYLICSDPSEQGACGQCKGCKLAAAGTHPDLMIVEPEEKGKIIKVEQVRRVVEFTAKRAQFDGYRVVIIAPAEAMNVNASNALLKSLEEPGEKTVLILVSHQISGILATIRSRCQAVDFKTPASEDCLPWLEASLAGTNAAEHASVLLSVAVGAPLAAKGFAKSNWLAERSTLISEWLNVLTGTADPVYVAGRWAGLPHTELLDGLMAWQIDVSRIVAGAPESVVNKDLFPSLQTAARIINSSSIHSFYEHLQQVQAMLAGPSNPNLQLLFERLLIKWSETKNS